MCLVSESATPLSLCHYSVFRGSFIFLTLQLLGTDFVLLVFPCISEQLNKQWHTKVICTRGKQEVHIHVLNLPPSKPWDCLLVSLDLCHHFWSIGMWGYDLASVIAAGASPSCLLPVPGCSPPCPVTFPVCPLPPHPTPTADLPALAGVMGSSNRAAVLRPLTTAHAKWPLMVCCVHQAFQHSGGNFCWHNTVCQTA